MAVHLTDDEIAELIAVQKVLPQDHEGLLKLRRKDGHKRRDMPIRSGTGLNFRIILRQSEHNLFDFSAILAYCLPGSNRELRLRRYNGRSHQHTNKLEREQFYAYHIQCATERYQASGLREDAWAEPTDRYCDLAGAIECMIRDCGFCSSPASSGQTALDLEEE